ncbi:MAG: hypothetical protein PHG14_00480 [Desulfobacter postgatei]|uniref:hypothetical protein n=1 Tax=Desulfobacter postgatei TaxID=2293 RepID=UPI0023F09A8E|nr:hypothetical protein [Desulfobacter postgatei]MDD4272184.1 hypothetical protein [Desulfobacter postgatei]
MDILMLFGKKILFWVLGFLFICLHYFYGFSGTEFKKILKNKFDKDDELSSAKKVIILCLLFGISEISLAYFVLNLKVAIIGFVLIFFCFLIGYSPFGDELGRITSIINHFFSRVVKSIKVNDWRSKNLFSKFLCIIAVFIGSLLLYCLLMLLFHWLYHFFIDYNLIELLKILLFIVPFLVINICNYMCCILFKEKRVLFTCMWTIIVLFLMSITSIYPNLYSIFFIPPILGKSHWFLKACFIFSPLWAFYNSSKNKTIDPCSENAQLIVDTISKSKKYGDDFEDIFDQFNK